MPAVSVIIPTYKHRDFVLATLDSVFAQTFTDYEVIVINDGSPDDTAALLRPLAEAGRIRYIEQENTGQSLARNRGIAAACGEFIALLDDDDLWPPDKLAWQVDAMGRHPDAGVIAGPADVMDANNGFMYKTPLFSEMVFEKSFEGSPILTPGMTLIRAEVLEQVGGFNPDIWGADDWDLWLRISKSHRILMEDQNALFYRKHAGNASKNLCRMFDNCWRVLEIHLPEVPAAQRRHVTRLAYQWFYGYMGEPMMIKSKHCIKSGQFHLLPPYAARLAKLSKMLVGNPVAVRRLLRDCLPKRLNALLPRRAAQRSV